MKKFTKTVEMEVSDAVAAGLHEVYAINSQVSGKEVTFAFTYSELVRLFELVEEAAIHRENNIAR